MQWKKRTSCSLLLICTGLMSVLIGRGSSQAQVVSDSSLFTLVNTSNGQNFLVEGGVPSGGNLFHSFQEFSVPSHGSVTFARTSEINRVVARVTGSQASWIDGSISIQGSADLLLINPNGLIFGPNSALDIDGSVVLSTASSIDFSDDKSFGVGQGSGPPLLSVGTPMGLQFGERAGSIVNQNSQRDALGDPEFGVDVGQTLAVVGNGIIIDGGGFTAPGGRLEIGSVGDSSFVGLIEELEGWSLSFQDTIPLSDIVIRDAATVTASKAILTEDSGAINITGKVIEVDGSAIFSLNGSQFDGGILRLQASESVKLQNGAFVLTGSFGDGDAGTLVIETGDLILSDGSFIDASTQGGQGDGGDIIITATGTLELDGDISFVQIASSSFSTGRSGDVQIESQDLTLVNGGQISTAAFGSGDGGDLTIEVLGNVDIRGTGQIDGLARSSGLFSEADGPGAGGQITIRAPKIHVVDGGTISASAPNELSGSAGQILIQAQESIQVEGASSGIRASSSSQGDAGDLQLETPTLVVGPGGEITVSSEGSGSAGNLVITGQSIQLQGDGQLSATTRSQEGDIFLQARDVTLQAKSAIRTDATEAASGGNIEIGAEVLTLLDQSEITADAVQGQGGNIRISSRGTFLSPESAIRASSEFAQDGIVEINSPDVDPSQGLVDTSQPIAVPDLIEGCAVAGSSASRFIRTGRGGIRPDPRQPLGSEMVWEDLQPPQRLIGDSVPVQEVSVADLDPYGLALDPDGQMVILATLKPGQRDGCR